MNWSICPWANVSKNHIAPIEGIETCLCCINDRSAQSRNQNAPIEGIETYDLKFPTIDVIGKNQNASIGKLAFSCQRLAFD